MLKSYCVADPSPKYLISQMGTFLRSRYYSLHLTNEESFENLSLLKIMELLTWQGRESSDSTHYSEPR